MALNMASNYGASLIAVAVNLVATPVLIHHLGVPAYGVWGVVMATSGYLALADLGFGNATTKIVAEHSGRRDDLVLRAFNTTFWCLCVFGLLALGVGLGLASVVPDLFHIDSALRHQSETTFRLLAVMVAVTLPGSAWLGLLVGYQRFDLVSLSTAISSAAIAAVSIAVALAGGGLVALAGSVCAISVLALVVPFVLVRRLVPGFRISIRLVDRASLRRTTSLSSWYLVQNLASVIGADLDLFVVGAILGVRAVAVYSVAIQLGTVASKVVGVLAQAYFPHISALSKDGDRAAMRAAMYTGTRLVIGLALPVNLVLMILAAPVVQAWVGRDVDQSAAVLVWVAAIGAVGALTTIAWQVVGGVGQARRAGTIAIVYSAVDLGASVALARPLGPAGVAVGSLVGLTLVNMPLIVRSSLRIVGATLGGWAGDSLLPHVVPAVVSAVALLALRPVLPANVMAVAGAGAAAFLVYEGAYALWGCPDQDRRAVAQAVRRRLAQLRARPETT